MRLAKRRLAAAEARIDQQADDMVAYDTAYAAGLAAERAKVEAERAKAERVIADFAARDAQQAASLDAERMQTAKAIAAFSALAERIDALATERTRRPWWRRLAELSLRGKERRGHRHDMLKAMEVPHCGIRADFLCRGHPNGRPGAPGPWCSLSQFTLQGRCLLSAAIPRRTVACVH